VEYDVFSVSPGGSSLYERLGGRPFIDRFASDFVDGLANPQLNAQNPRVERVRRRLDAGALKKKVADAFSAWAGGPGPYTGRSMREAHAPLELTEADWAIVASDIRTSLDKHGVAAAERAEALQLLDRAKQDIVLYAR
jgi:hemoglobin